MTDKPLRSNRRWFQFSLRSLLLFMLLASAGFAWLGFKVQQGRWQWKAINKIEVSGGIVQAADGATPNAWRRDSYYLWFPPVVKAVSFDAPVSDLSALAELKDLKQLYLGKTQLKDVSPLTNLKSLELLSLDTTKVTALSPLTKLSSLRHLILDDHQKDHDLSVLVKLTDLESLLLADATMSELSELTHFTNLQELVLRETSVNDLSPLVKLKSLKVLYLINTKVKDLSTLNGCKSLHHLYLGNAKVSSEQLKALQKALPNCIISRL